MEDYLGNILETGDIVAYTNTRGVSLGTGVIGKIKNSIYVIGRCSIVNKSHPSIRASVSISRKNAYNLIKVNEEDASEEKIRLSRTIKGLHLEGYEPEDEESKTHYEMIIDKIKENL